MVTPFFLSDFDQEFVTTYQQELIRKRIFK